MADRQDEITLPKDKVSSSHNVIITSSSKFLGEYWLFFTLLLFVIGLLIHQVPLILISLILFLTGGAARLWERYCLTRVEFQRRLSTNRVFFGGEVQLEIEVDNRKPLPLPWIQVDDEIPADVTLLKGRASQSHRENRVFLNNLLSLSWYHRIKRRYTLRCLHRGLFTFGPTRIRSGDLFGIFNRQMEIDNTDYLMVYPKIVPLEKLGIPSRQPFGDIRTRRTIFEDPILTQGIRDYQSGDSIKRIHWKATARLGQLQTRVFEPTTTTDMGIFLDVRTSKFWGNVPPLLELAIITAASISNYALNSKYRVGLYVNQRKRFPDEPIRLPPSQHADQFLHILEALAQIDAFETMPIARLVQNESRNFAWGSTMVVITAMPSDALYSTLLNIKRGGRKVALIVVGGSEPSIIKDGLTVYYIREDIAWRELELLSIKGA
jgi:uncharacterized protein (DUF58 family)